MKRLHFFLLLAGLLLTACGGDDDMATGSGNSKPVEPSTPTTPTTPTSWTLEITSPVTRGLSLSGNTVTPTWSTSDKIYVYYGDQRVGVLHPKENKDNAKYYVQLVGNLDTPTSGPYSVGDRLSFYYQCDKGFSDYTGQDGTLATIASSFDYHKAENVPITAVDAVNRKVTVGQFNLMPQQAIARFSFTRPLVAGDVITITGAQHSVSATLKADVEENTGYVDVALPLYANATSPTLTFDIKHGNDANFYKTIMADKSMQNGKTYSAKLVLAVQLNGVWWATRNIADPKYGGKKFPDNEYDGGHLFAWGDVTTRNSGGYDTPYDMPDLNYYVGSNLTPKYDAAYQIWGSAWRMPTETEIQKLSADFPDHWRMENELKNYPGTNVLGMMFSDPDKLDKYIFLRAAGYWEANAGGANEGHYWTSTVWTFYPNTTPPQPYPHSSRFVFKAKTTTNIWGYKRNCGCPIRPVLNI